MKWNRTGLENTPHPKYLGVTLDRTFSYKHHIHNTKMKVTTRNNLIIKLSSSKWRNNASTIRTTELRRTNKTPHRTPVNLDESLARGHDSPWTTWRYLNRLRTGYTCSKEQRKKWQYFDGDTTCECGLATKNTAHMLQCTLLARPCTLDDLSKFNDTAKSCVERWKTV